MFTPDPKAILEVLEGNRRLTMRTIDAFPEDKLFSYSPAEPLRPFADMVKEILALETAYVRGIATGEWAFAMSEVSTKADLMAEAESVRAETHRLWEKVTAERLMAVEVDNLFGTSPTSNLDRLQYALENEVHHRGQGFTYLRLLGIEPPAFYER